MTSLGKFLVLVITGISLTFLAWAIGVYTHRPEWVSRTPEGGERIVGRVDKLRERIESLARARDIAENRYRGATASLSSYERVRPQLLASYAEQMLIVRTGKDARGQIVAAPAIELIDPATGRVAWTVDRAAGRAFVDRTNKAAYKAPRLAGEPEPRDLQSLQYYRGAIVTMNGDLARLQGELEKLVARQKQLTELVNGTGEVRGLRQQLVERQELLRNSDQEQEYLMPVLTNRWAEAALVLKRMAALEAREQELRKAADAAAARD